jgi:predicted GIY-YIG superfamily endonuclease
VYYVYLIQSPDLQRTYIDYGSDLKQRIRQHVTSEHKDWRLVYYEAYLSEYDAKIREQKLKHHGKGIQQLKTRIANSLSTSDKEDTR